jgi:replicative DNA helicase Mcm
LNDESENLIIDFFVKTRNAVGEKKDTVPITARTLEAAFRLATAHARMRLSETIEEVDAEAATKLLMDNLRSVGIDPETGQLDADVISVGVSRSQAKKISIIKEIIKELSSRDTALYKAARKEEVFERCLREGIDKPEHLITKMKRNGEILCPAEGFYKLV